MKQTEILSTLQLPETLIGSTASSALGMPGSVPRLLVFDACHVGVVLRAVLWVEAVMAVGLLFVRPIGYLWLLDLAALTAVTQPAVLLWLLLGCALKSAIGGWPVWAQAGAGIVLGAVAGVFAVALWWWLGAEGQPLWLAAACGGALLASVLVVGLVWRARAQLPASTTARLAELQSRIRPHFLFNTLNSAIALVRAEPARAEALLEDLSELFRSALADSQQAVPLAQELALAERYLAIEQVRFGPRLRIEWQTDPAAGAAMLPPLLLQPLVENAVKHGVEPSVSGADIRISTERRGDTVVIKVLNTMPAGAGTHGLGLALANVRERLTLMHDLRSSFKSGEVDGQYMVRLVVPL